MNTVQSNIKKAKNYLDKHQCIAVPTETVYGLAGNAYSDLSVKKIFALKKRPRNNPLIVHYSDIKKLEKLPEIIHGIDNERSRQIKNICSETVFNIGKSAEVGAEYIKKVLDG